MRVFLSTSGERSRAVGIALREWLPLILQYTDPWLATADISAGKRWADEVGRQLDQSSFGILCLTQENLSAPWVLFEAGAPAKSVSGGSVVPYLIGVDIGELTGPLTQFQAKKAEEFSTLEMVKSINERAEHPIPEIRLDQLFKMTWPNLAAKLASIPPETNVPSMLMLQHRMLEELIAVAREIEQRTRLSPSPFRLTRRLKDMPDWERRGRGLLLLHQKPQAIETVRKNTGRTLEEAKALIEAWEEGG